jgi:hypothetical protein
MKKTNWADLPLPKSVQAIYLSLATLVHQTQLYSQISNRSMHWQKIR